MRALVPAGLLVAWAAGCLGRESSGGFAGSATVGGNDAGTSVEADGNGVGGEETGGSGGDGADAAGGSGGGPPNDGAAIMCSVLPFGCVCSPAEPSQVGACTTTSVVRMAEQRAVCCDDEFKCICVAYECVRAGSSCACQLAQAGAAGTRVDDCSAVTGNAAIKCCRSYGQCICSAMDCLPIETRVANCSLDDLLTCDANGKSVSRCDRAGG